MLMAVKNQLKVSVLTIKYALIKEMLNKTTFFTNIIFMILNNASFIIQMLILYSLKDNVGGYTFSQVLLLWGLAAGTYGFSHFFFKPAYSLSDTIINGKLDSYLVQPKNVLLSAITSDVETSALGDMISGYILLFVSGFSITKFFLFTFFMISGGLALTGFTVILSSLSFWFTKSDIIVETGNKLLTSFATYPDGIFKGMARIMLFTIIPVGLINYIPVKLIDNFNIYIFILIISFVLIIIVFAFIIFYNGLKRYSSSNLMIARV